jgi:cob(I)alamin adenosyltransferase
MLIVTTGNGKGKTTAAIGQAIRAVGHGKHVFFAQFIKCDGYPSGEDLILRNFPGQITFLKGGKGFVGICGDNFPFSEHRAAAEKTLARVKAAACSGKYDLVVLDEANVAVDLKLLSIKELSTFLDSVPDSCDIVVTGRNASASIQDRADFVTECLEIKHPFHNHVAAKKGIEY